MPLLLLGYLCSPRPVHIFHNFGRITLFLEWQSDILKALFGVNNNGRHFSCLVFVGTLMDFLGDYHDWGGVTQVFGMVSLLKFSRKNIRKDIYNTKLCVLLPITTRIISRLFLIKLKLKKKLSIEITRIIYKRSWHTLFSCFIKEILRNFQFMYGNAWKESSR